MNMKINYTPLPWKPYFFRSPRGARECWGVGSKETGLMGIASNISLEANARFIAQACNGYEKLLEALERIAYEPQGKADASDREVLDACVEIAKQAIAREKVKEA